MSTTIPETLPNKVNSSEKLVFKLLKKLPKDCVVFFEPKIRGKTPDFVVISPRFGAMVIEVKSWSISYIEDVSNGVVHVKHRGKIEERQNPTAQARSYMFDLMHVLKNMKEYTSIIGKTGEHKGKLLFPVGYSVLMPNMSREDVTSNNLSDFFYEKNYGFKEDLNSVSTLDSSQIEIFLSRRFGISWEFSNLNKNQMSIISNAINPVIKVSNNSISHDLTSFNLPEEDPQQTMQHEDKENVGDYIPKSIYDIVTTSVSELIEKSKGMQEKIDQRKKIISELKQQIAVAELLINGSKPNEGLIDNIDQREIAKSKNTIINGNCKNIEDYSKKIEQQLNMDNIDEAMNTFEKMKLHTVSTGLKLEYIRELKLLLKDMSDNASIRSKVDSIALLLNPESKGFVTKNKQLVKC